MRQKSGPPETAEQHIKSIRRATRKKYSTEEKIRIVLSGLRGEHSVDGLPGAICKLLDAWAYWLADPEFSPASECLFIALDLE